MICNVTSAIRACMVAAGIVAFVVTSAGHPTLAEAADTWTEIKANNVTVLANGGTGDARTLTWQVQQIRSVLVSILPWAKVNLDRPFSVLAVNNETRMRALLPKYWQRGASDAKPVSVWVSGSDRHYLVIRSDERAEDRQFINPHVHAYFSFVSLVIQNSLQANMPMWFTRGLAGVLSNTIVRDSHVLVGAPIPWHLRELRERPRLRLATLLGATRETREVMGDGLPQFDAQAWAFVHFLLFADSGVRSASLNQFFALVNGGKTPAVAEVEAFGAIDKLESDFARYLGREVFAFAKMPLDESVKKEKFGERALSVTEAASALALFHVAMGQPVEARAAIAEARKSGGVLGDTYLAEALLLKGEGKDDDVKAALERAVSEGSQTGYAHYELARLQWQAESSPELLAAREKLLRRAAELNPGWSWTFAMLADIRSQLGHDDGLDFIVRAIRMAPTEASHRLTAGLVLLRAGRHAEALKAVDAGLALASDESERARARELQQAIERSKPQGSRR
jgi:tetratricopeptide (TPR) repeat protein